MTARQEYSVEEAAQYLGLSEQAVRDKVEAGTLKARRMRGSQQFVFSRAALAMAKSGEPSRDTGEDVAASGAVETDVDVRRLVARLHRTLRDLDGPANLMERFDELTKLLMAHAHSRGFQELRGASVRETGRGARRAYASALEAASLEVPRGFRRMQLNDRCVHAVLETLADVDTTRVHGDLHGLVYEEMVRDIFEKGANQQFFTPHTVVRCMVEMVRALKVRGAVCDPASGTGGFLIEMLRQRAPFETYTALEIDPRLAWVTGNNLALHGCSAYTSLCLPRGGSLGPDAARDAGTFDAIVTNPPFGSDYSDREGLGKFVLGRGRSSRRRGVLFVERCLDMLREGGVLAIVLDDGVLHHPSNEDARRMMLARAEVLGVVSLPATTFRPYASVESSIVVLRKSARPSRRRATFFAKAEHVGKKNNGGEDIVYDAQGHPRLNDDLTEIAARWRRAHGRRPWTKDERCFRANLRDALRGDDTAHAHRMDFAFHHPARALVRTALATNAARLVRLADLCEEVNGLVVPATAMSQQRVPYTGLAHIRSNSERYRQVHVPADSLKSAVRRYAPGDVLFSRMRPNLRKCVAIVDDMPGFCSSECVVLRPRDARVDPRVLAAILRSDFVYGQLVHHITGIGRPRISVKNLRALKIPAPFDVQRGGAWRAFTRSMSSAQDLAREAETMRQRSLEQERTSVDDLVAALLRRDEG